MKLPADTQLRWLGAAAHAARYRFFLVAWAFPYLLGAAVAYRATGELDEVLLLIGLLGLLSLSIGIEGMNEYFDSRIGGDRVFQYPERRTAAWYLPLGVGGLIAAVGTAVCLAWLRGWGLLAFVFFGGAAALAYLMPPVHLSYRGLGETLIALSYGPGLVTGSFFLQAGYLGWQAAVVSLVPAILIFALTLANEVPDFYGDRIVGKRNLVVRLGREKSVCLFGIAMSVGFCVVACGVALRLLPALLGLVLLLVPVAARAYSLAVGAWDTPVRFLPVIRNAVLLYIAGNTVAILGYVAR